MPKYFVSSGCSYSDTHSTEFKLWNNFVAEYLDRELVQLGIGGVGNQFIAHSFINKIKELLDNDVPSEDIFGIVQWSMIHRYAFVSGKEQLNDNPNIHAGHRVIYPRSFTDYNNLPIEETGWVSIAPWQMDQDTATETPDLHHLSIEYYLNIQKKYTDLLNTLTVYSLVKSFYEKHNIKVMFTWLDNVHRQQVLNAEPDWVYSHLKDDIKGSIDLPAIRQEVIKYEKFAEEVWCENDYRGHPNEVGHKMYFEEHIKPELVDV